MKSKLFATLCAGVVLLLVSGPLLAHHGGAQYDKEHAVTVTGTVTEYLFTNPHVQIHFDVKDEKGNVEEWLAECPSPNRMSRTGWYKDALKPQDEITITGNPTKDGSKSIRLEKVLFPNGSTLIGRSR